MHLRIKPVRSDVARFYENAKPAYAEDWGFDLFCPDSVVVPARKTVFVPLHIAIAAYVDSSCATGLPYLLMPRSSLCKTPLRLSNSVGVVDIGYRGELKLCFDNISDADYKIEAGDRLVQLLNPTQFSGTTCELCTDLDESDRGAGGFGSSGR